LRRDGSDTTALPLPDRVGALIALVHFAGTGRVASCLATSRTTVEQGTQLLEAAAVALSSTSPLGCAHNGTLAAALLDACVGLLVSVRAVGSHGPPPVSSCHLCASLVCMGLTCCTRARVCV
jgi:hypothetical protein